MNILLVTAYFGSFRLSVMPKILASRRERNLGDLITTIRIA